MARSITRMSRPVIMSALLLGGCGCGAGDRQNGVDGQVPKAPAISEAPSLDGTWEVVSMRAGDQAMPAFEGSRYTFCEKLLQIDYNPDVSHPVHGALTYQVDPTNRPNWIRVEGIGFDIAYWEEGTYSIQDNLLRLEIGSFSSVSRRVEPQPDLRPLTFDATLTMLTTPLLPCEETDDDRRIEGRWRSRDRHADEYLFQDGKMVPSARAKPQHPADGHYPPTPFHYFLDPTKDPKQINLIADSRYAEWGGVTYLAGIYKLEADRLTICAARECQGRPSAFDVQDDERYLTLSLQRVEEPTE